MQLHLPHLFAMGVIGCDLSSAVQEDGEAMPLLIQPQGAGNRQKCWGRNLQDRKFAHMSALQVLHGLGQ